ncbi:MAG: bifunctional glycosyltransferase/class I SAM-dependent methyltransferase [Acidobacteriaceae bacterium]
MNAVRKQRVLIFIVAYHAETTIVDVVRRIPTALVDDYEIEILIIDDSSKDQTFERSHELAKRSDIPFTVRVLFNPANQGYGGNQKLGYHYAIENGFDFVALLHGDGQYAPECLPALLKPLAEGGAAAVFGSRMLTPKGARKGGMPLYKFVGNRILTWVQNRLLRTNLSEFHSGYRIYSVTALRSIPFERNSNGFHFDTEIIIQLVIGRLPIVELPIPTYYGDEICRVNGMAYALNVVIASIHARLQELSLFYDRRYDCSPGVLHQYQPKLTFESTQRFAINAVAPGAKVLDIGCATGYVAAELKKTKNCRVTGVDRFPLPEDKFDSFYLADLNQGLGGIPVSAHDYVLLLDVIEHIVAPAEFLDDLRSRMGSAELIISTGNIAFIVTRFMLMIGQFNYGERGILDLTHTRLYTLSAMKSLLSQSGFIILETRAIPAPFPLALGDNWLSRLLVNMNSLFIKLAPGLFGYQMIMRVKALPTVKTLLENARQTSDKKASLLEEAISL